MLILIVLKLQPPAGYDERLPDRHDGEVGL
jgi:hypothetical protein